MNIIKSLIRGNKLFRKYHFTDFEEELNELIKHGQKPQALFITCCDSRITPDLMLGSKPGDLFVMRNIGNFVPPYEKDYSFDEYGRILEQYDGSLENFIMDLGDCTSVSAVISHNFNAVELLGLRELMVNRDIKRIKEYEKIWRRARGLSENELPTIYDENNISKRYKTFWVKTPQTI